MKKKLFSILLVLAFALLAVTACGASEEPAQVPAESESAAEEGSVPSEASIDEEEIASETVTVTDMLGREVEIPADVTRVVAIGPGALRLYVYAGNLDYVVGVENMETGEVSGKPYMLANPDLAALPIIGQGGPNNAPDPEKLLTVEPQVIFSTYASEASVADELQAKTGIPVVVLSYGSAGITTIFGDKVTDSLALIGQISGEVDKAQAAVDFIVQAQEDLDARTKDIADEDKPVVYLGGLGFRGAHGIESTQGGYALLDVIHANNVVDETGQSGSVMIDKEQLLEWDPDFIFIDYGGYSLVAEDYEKTPALYEALSAVQNGNVYSQLPYNYYSTNIDTAIADAYFLGKVIYPDAFTDVEPAEKADEIYTALLGQPVYETMVASYGEFGALDLQ